MMPAGYLAQCVRLLLLPIRAGNEAKCARALRMTLRLHGVVSADYKGWIELHIDRWREDGTAPDELSTVIEAVLKAADSSGRSLLPEKYLFIHRRLMASHLMSSDEARAFLSNAFLMCDLAQSEQLSAAQIAKLLTGRDERISFSRQAVSFLLDSLGLGRVLLKEQLIGQWHKDERAEPPFFADADLSTAIEIVSQSAESLGFPTKLHPLLETLAPPGDLSTFTPYLQILHYQCVIAEFFDHAMTEVYEFSPRGVAALWLFEQYPDTLAGAGNPFLNNMKSVGRADEVWARSKKQAELPGAMALLRILEGLEAMGFLAKRELGKLLRLWIHRIIRMSGEHAVPLPADVSADFADKLMLRVGQGNTATYGIVEQRTVDAIAFACHRPPHIWRPRGLGDSVNATNISRRKFGDCDFQNPSTKEICAYESHGGVLTDIYVDEHLRTLKKVLKVRKDELQGIADLGNWTVTVKFIAHLVQAAPRAPVNIDGLVFNLEFTTFQEFIESNRAKVALDDWKAHVLDVLTTSRTPAAVKEAFRLIAA